MRLVKTAVLLEVYMKRVEVALSETNPVSAVYSNDAIKSDWLLFQYTGSFFKYTGFNTMKDFEL